MVKGKKRNRRHNDNSKVVRVLGKRLEREGVLVEDVVWEGSRLRGFGVGVSGGAKTCAHPKSSTRSKSYMIEWKRRGHCKLGFFVCRSRAAETGLVMHLQRGCQFCR